MKKFLQKKDLLFGIEKWKRYLIYLVSSVVLLLCMIFPSLRIVSNIGFSIISGLSYWAYVIGYFFCVIYLTKDKKNLKYKNTYLILFLVIDGLLLYVANFASISIYSILSFSLMSLMFKSLTHSFLDFLIDMKKLINELIIRIVLLITICLFSVGLILYLLYKFDLALIIIKIAVGFAYLLIILGISNFVFFKRTSFFKEEVTQSLYYKLFVIIIFLGVIFTIPLYISWCGLTDEPYKNFITIYASTVGGLITLAGVAWTIKNQDKQRKNDEKLKFKPIFVIEGYSSEQNVWSKSNTRMVQFNSNHKKKEDGNEYFTLDDIILSNSDNSNLFIKNIYINNEPLGKKFDKFLVYKGEIIEISLKGDYSYDNINMTIEITDMLENEYRYNIIYGENKEYSRHKKNEITEICYTRFIEKVEEIKRG